jgi:23S rRNA (guanosine2251-2'-O)-methyltransferase
MVSTSQIIYGRHPVLTALRADAPLEEIMVAPGAGGKWLFEVRRLARAAGVRLKTLDRAALDRVCGTSHHQGIAARRGAYAYRTAGELLDRLPIPSEPALLVAADGLTDPMNLGNLCRSALAAGAHGLIIPRDRSVGVTATVAKAAAGALEYLPVYRVTNLADTLRRLRETGLDIIGTDSQAPTSLFQADLTGPLVLVIGREDKGLRPRVRQQCDLVLSIPLAVPQIGSLNAASAGAVALFEARRQRLLAVSSLPA